LQKTQRKWQWQLLRSLGLPDKLVESDLWIDRCESENSSVSYGGNVLSMQPLLAGIFASDDSPCGFNVPLYHDCFPFPPDLDHTADIQLHSWGSTLEEALEQVVLAMFSYMSDITRVEIDPEREDTFTVEGHDMDSLLFNLLDEFLYRFATNEWIIRDVHVQKLQRDRSPFSVTVTGYGEGFTLSKHTQGTEVKAITYSAMQIFVHGKRVEGDNERARSSQAAAASAAAGTSDAAASHVAPSAAAASAVAASPPTHAPLAKSRSASGTHSADDGGEVVNAPLTDAEMARHATHGADIYVIVDI
jgi:SHS2 domain-containing protein